MNINRYPPNFSGRQSHQAPSQSVSPTSRPRHPGVGYLRLVLLPLCPLALCAIPPLTLAHKTQISQNIAGVWHIDPNDNPTTKQPSRVWIALTRRGGQIIPLTQTACHMAVFKSPRRPHDKPILQPVLVPMDAERYRGIPSANVKFPHVGLYQLELSCTPKISGLQPFRLTYDVTVSQ